MEKVGDVSLDLVSAHLRGTDDIVDPLTFSGASELGGVGVCSRRNYAAKSGQRHEVESGKNKSKERGKNLSGS